MNVKHSGIGREWKLCEAPMVATRLDGPGTTSRHELVGITWAIATNEKAEN